MPILLSLLAAVAYGLSDFNGGLFSRRGGAWAVSLVGQITGGSLVLLLVLVTDGSPTGTDLAWSLVAGLGNGWFGARVADLVPTRDDALGLLALAALGAVLANVVNNLPAAMLLAPLAAPLGVTPVLALLIGINVGSSLTWSARGGWIGRWRRCRATRTWRHGTRPAAGSPRRSSRCCSRT